MRVVGLDLSLTATGIATVGLDGERPQVCTVPAGKTLGHQRLATILDAVQAAVGNSCRLVVIEGPSYGSSGRGQHERAGLWWLITHKLWSDHTHGDGPPCAVAAPAARAKYAAGVGTAGKDQVLTSVVRRYPNVDVCTNDQADALVLACMGARWLGHPVEPFLPQTHLAAMNRVAWPERTTP